MKSFYLLSLALFAASGILGQTPAKINYQAVARDVTTGNAVVDQAVYIVASIRQGGPGGNIVYQEDHPDVSTNAFGLFSLFIGGGEVVAGSFSDIQWGADAYWLEVQIDLGEGLENLGAMQFVSVPYAIHAGTVDHVEDADADPTNELINNAFYSSDTGGIVIQEGPDNEVNIDLSEFSVEDADSDPTNELITDAYYSAEEGGIVIQEGPDNEVHIDLSEFSVEDADSDPTNEMITEFSLFGTNLFIQEVNPHTVSLSRFKIDSVKLSDDNTLVIYEGGVPNGVDLSSFADEEHWFRDEEEPVVYNEADRIGIGTAEPGAKLQVKNEDSTAPDFVVTNSADIPMLHIGANRIGIGTDEPSSSVDMRGSLALGVTLIEEGDSPYVVSPTDNIIVCRLSSVQPSDLIVQLPDPATCPGRLITVRKTGPNPGAVSVFIDFNGAQLDYGTAVLILSGSQPKTVTLLSLGGDGWTELISP